ncbi:inositol phospholipid synthesis protein Scs3p [Podospora australis]|uniref:Acyl-coenzyme A diphosphatase SCS3 n=1 Tax=Podospora australis TaxID=1536484 RepID=A0AAN7AGY3_9PEZI|nr:inositol phospholipid synthesis protein Scs3p [Podospora australis]
MSRRIITPSSSPPAPPTPSTFSPHHPSRRRPRNNPVLPTPSELLALSIYPILLVFGALFAVLNPTVRNAPYDFASQAHDQSSALSPSYFARKNNLFNVLFVKRGWGWISLAFVVFIFTHPAVATTKQRARAGIRWGMVTLWWVFVTQWFFGPAIIDRGFRWTGGKCEEKISLVNAAMDGMATPHGGRVVGQEVRVKDVFSAAACKAAGGKWSGGHDISGHVFLLVLGSVFLLQEVGWVVSRWAKWHEREERTVVMPDGAVKGATVEVDKREEEYREERRTTVGEALGRGGQFAGAVVVVSGWMLLMTAIYFHTWFEKLTGLLVAMAGLYVTYILPRWVPALRGIVGLPGI